MDPGGGPGPPWVFELLYMFNLWSWASFQNLRFPFSCISLASLIQIATILPKNLTKTIKTFTMVIVF